MTINYEKNEINMTQKEARQAGNVGSREYYTLLEVRSKFPDCRIIVKSASKSRDNLKGLTIPYMEKYIKTHDNDEKTIMGDFNALRGYNEDGTKDEEAVSLTYGELKKWFLEQYPEVQNMNRAAIILAARKAA